MELLPRQLLNRRHGGLALIIAGLCLYALYLWLWASPRYEAEAKFFVRSYENRQISAAGLLGSFLPGQASMSTTDANIIAEFIQSKEMLDALDEELDLRQQWSARSIDLFTRLDEDGTTAAFLDHYRKRISVTVQTTGIVDVKAQGFTPEAATQLLSRILQNSEAFINSISHNLAGKQLEFIREQVDEAERDLAEARRSVQEFQNRVQSLSPQSDSEMLLGIISSLEQELAAVRAERIQVGSFLAPDSARVRTLDNRIAALERQIEQEKQRIVGGDASLNETLTEFQTVLLSEEFARQAYQSAYTSLEQIQLEVASQLKYLVLIEPPTAPDVPTHPRQWYLLITVSLVTMLAYSILRLIIAIVREHQ